MSNPAAQAAAAAGDYFGALRRRYVYPVTILPAVLFACVYAAFAIRPQYQATATILLEASSIPKDIIETTVSSNADQQIELVQGQVMSPENLRSIVQEIDPYPMQKDLSPGAKIQRILADSSVERVDPVTFKPEAESNAFSLHYDNPNPNRAAMIANSLAELFLTYNQRQRSEAAVEAAGFLQKQVDNVTQQMRQLDVDLAALETKYGEARPDYLTRNQNAIDEMQLQLEGLQQQILTAQQKESVLTLQLSQMSPNLISQSGDLTDIATVRAQLTEAEQRYTPEHPEVKRLRRALETLVAQSAASKVGGSAQTANNPKYLMTETELQGARTELTSLQAQAAATQVKLAQYQGLVQRTPGADRAFAEVLRRRQALQNDYEHAQTRLEDAKLAETFENQQGGERFTLLRAPSVPKSPVYPNRVGLILLGLVFGTTLAGIAVAISESLDGNVRNIGDLPFLDDVPVLANIPFIKNRYDRRRRAIVLSSFAAAYVVALLVVAITVMSASHRVS